MDVSVFDHPKQLEHRTARASRLMKARVKRIDETNITHALKLRYVHVRERSVDYPFSLSNKGGVTVTYQLPERRGDRMIRVACAIVHENDSYCKREGRYQAAKKFRNGEVITLRVPKNWSTPQFLKNMFRHITAGG
jgi:hypothetical protein